MRASLVFALLPSIAIAAAPEHLAGLRGSAEIVRDGAGIAHVLASDEHDLFFLQGWVHAQDRLFQMDVQRRRASGTLGMRTLCERADGSAVLRGR